MAKFVQGFCFDDVLLIPKHSTIASRSDVDLSVQLPRDIKLKIPFVSAPMKTVTGVEFARTLAQLGGMAILHRFDEYDVLLENFIEADAPGSFGRIGSAIGIKPIDLELAQNLYKVGCRSLCVDVAHGDHSLVKRFLENLRKECPDALIIAGNVATDTGAQMLWEAGADIIRSGIGGGSICSTRIETGNGYPLLSTLQNIKKHPFHSFDKEDLEPPMIIADGGIRTAGDCVKSLCFSDLVMLGNLFAGTDEAPGDIITINGQQFKSYAGSSTHKQKHIEGVIGLVPYKGSVRNVVQKLVEGIKSGCSYQGVNNIQELQQDPQFVVISNAGLRESHPHDVKL